MFVTRESTFEQRGASGSLLQRRGLLNVELGCLIAEGGQAHIYQASLFQRDDYQKFVAKVFKQGFSLAHLQRQLPLASRHPYRAGYMSLAPSTAAFADSDNILFACTAILYGTFLKDGRFAFLMRRYWGDLRTLIDLKLRDKNSQGPPFSLRLALRILMQIAWAMSNLHTKGVLHRGLKASNVLLDEVFVTRDCLHCDIKYDSFSCHVADYESSLIVRGAGFWRAPEVLEDLQKQRISNQNVKMWTQKMDVYSFAMTCYEVLTGHVPFSEYKKRDWRRVIASERSRLSNYVDVRLRQLLQRCWHFEPSKRPSFQVIGDELRRIYDRSDVHECLNCNRIQLNMPAFQIIADELYRSYDTHGPFAHRIQMQRIR